MEKGFTLIELLAVIVILAIIALIATPIVLNIINNVKENAQLRSAEMYLRGVEQAIMRKNMEASSNFNPTSCDINDQGNLSCVGYEETIVVEVKGEKPTDGSINFSEGKIDKAGLSFSNNNSVVKNEDGQLVSIEGTIEKICEAVTAANATYRVDDKTTPAGHIPEGNFEYGDEYICDVGDGEERRFFVVSTKDNSVSLLMDDNIIDSGVAWNTDGGTEPTTANAALKGATSNWKEGISVRLPSISEIGSPSGSDFQLLKLAHPDDGGARFYWTSDYSSYEEYYGSTYGEEDQLCVITMVGDTYFEEEIGGELLGMWRGSGSKACFLLEGENYMPGIRPIITISKYNLY